MTHPRATTRRAFTLTEALVAVIAIAIISVGLAAIFASVGDTVQRGRRISAINQYAAAIERRIRSDLSSITREGFLVIRNEYAGAGNEYAGDQLIPLSPESPRTARLRRVDELMFFARGNFVSARGTITPDVDAPRAREARIYYGHGQKQLEGADGFFRPYLDDPNADAELALGVRSGTPTAIGQANPNVYAGDWTLLRHATLLKTPAPFADFEEQLQPEEFELVADNELQINRQVAADSIFRAQAYWGEPIDANNSYEDDFENFSFRGAQAPPTFPSGIVDVATESLTDIRRRVMGLAVGSSPFVGSDGSGGGNQVFVETPTSIYSIEGSWEPWRRRRINGSPASPQQLFAAQLLRFTNADPSDNQFIIPNDRRQSLVHVQHAWMSDALPAASNEITFGSVARSQAVVPELSLITRGLPVSGAQANASEPADPQFPIRSRMRYENTPPGYNADVFGPDAEAAFSSDTGGFGAVLLAAARSDQQMVTNSQFIPRCTEFIVEWSFGERYTSARLADLMDLPGDPDELLGELIWYGAPRPIDSGIPLASVWPAAPRPTNGPDDDLEPAEVPTDNPYAFSDQRTLERHLLADLVIGQLSSQIENRQIVPPDTEQVLQLRRSAAQVPTTFYFGYADPRAVPVDFVDPAGVRRVGFDLNGDAYPDDIDGDGVFDDAWPWPRLLRITMSFADPVDQTVEDTFQFVVELPKDGDL